MSETIQIDDLVFGNPCKRDYDLIQRETYLDVLLPSLRKYTPPKNTSGTTKVELERMAKVTQMKPIVKNTLYDEGLLNMIKKTFVDGGASEEFVDTVINGVSEDVIPIITKLKFAFNRPRPGQLAPYFNVNLFPDFSFFVNSPSYPSAHVCLTAVTLEVLGNLYPDAYKKVHRVVAEVMDSRIHLGVHYPSDNDTSMVVAKAVLDNAEFKMKYRL